MTTLIQILEAIGSFLVGSAGRIGLFLIAGLVLVLPALALALAWRALSLRGRVAGRPWAEGIRFAPNHTWLAPEGTGVKVGLDEIGERILPSATAVELPTPGMAVHKGDPIAVVRAGRRVVRIGAPVDGTVVGVNWRARRDPRIVKDDPYGRGWLFTLAPASDSWQSLPGGLYGEAWLGAERKRLARFIEHELGLAAADGGELVAPAPALLGDDGWDRVVASFLNVAA